MIKKHYKSNTLFQSFKKRKKSTKKHPKITSIRSITSIQNNKTKRDSNNKFKIKMHRKNKRTPKSTIIHLNNLDNIASHKQASKDIYKLEIKKSNTKDSFLDDSYFKNYDRFYSQNDNKYLAPSALLSPKISTHKPKPQMLSLRQSAYLSDLLKTTSANKKKKFRNPKRSANQHWEKLRANRVHFINMQYRQKVKKQIKSVYSKTLEKEKTNHSVFFKSRNTNSGFLLDKQEPENPQKKSRHTSEKSFASNDEKNFQFLKFDTNDNKIESDLQGINKRITVLLDWKYQNQYLPKNLLKYKDMYASKENNSSRMNSNSILAKNISRSDINHKAYSTNLNHRKSSQSHLLKKNSPFFRRESTILELNTLPYKLQRPKQKSLKKQFLKTSTTRTSSRKSRKD